MLKLTEDQILDAIMNVLSLQGSVMDDMRIVGRTLIYMFPTTDPLVFDRAFEKAIEMLSPGG